MANEKQVLTNCQRLIDANAFITNIKKWYCEECHAQCKDYKEIVCRACNIDDIRIYIEETPTVDAVEVVHAQWKTECKNRHKCSNCGFGRNTDTQLGWNYCPNCGAKMDGDGQ